MVKNHPSILCRLISTGGRSVEGVFPNWHSVKAGYTLEKLSGHHRADIEK